MSKMQNKKIRNIRNEKWKRGICCKKDGTRKIKFKPTENYCANE